MTNVNPGNRDPRNGRFGGTRKFFSRDKSEDLLQDRDALAEDLREDRVPEPAPDHYETARDGSFDEVLDEYYESRDEYDPRRDRTESAESAASANGADHVEREPVARGKHHRREEGDSDGYGFSHGYRTDSEGYGYAHGHTSKADGYGYAHGYESAAAGAAGADYIEPELVPGDYIDGENNYGYTSRAADYDDRAHFDDYDNDYDDRAAYAEDRDDRTVAAAAGAGAAGAGSSTAAATGGVPKRGLAMILIAVALLLALWGVYAMTKGGSDDQAADDPAAQSAQNDPNAQGGQGQAADGQGGAGAGQGQNANDPNGQGANQNGEGENAQGQNAQGDEQNRQPGADNGQAGNQAGNNAPAGPNNPMTRENMTVNVYNNSAITGFADQVASQAREKGLTVGEVGNIPGEVATYGQNTVLFDPNTPDAEQRARELADQIGGIAIANDENIPAEARKPGSLTLVLAENREVTL